jgi:thiopurine S-methyltransferase
VRFLADSGWNVLGIDFSHRCWARRGARPARQPRYGDFFAPIAEAPFEVVYERAFLCALPRRPWRDRGRRVAELVNRAACSRATSFSTQGSAARHSRCTPWPTSRSSLPAFERTEDAAVGDSIDVFRGKERWQVWQRR